MSKSSFFGSFVKISDAKWTIYPPGTCYLVMVRLIPEEVGGFSVYAPKLPGATSQGETVAEALANITEALAGCLQSYKAHGKKIPWAAEISPCPAGELERFVVVDIRTEEKVS